MTTQPKRRGRPPYATRVVEIGGCEFLFDHRNVILAAHKPREFAVRRAGLDPVAWRKALRFLEARAVRPDAIIAHHDLEAVASRMAGHA
jgi:hypothetical protein